MQTDKTLTRREFTVASALAILSGVVITISGCGSSSPAGPSGTPSGTPSSGDKVGDISNNHGHSAVITSAQLTAANALLLNIQGSASHNHTVQLSAGDITTIAGNGRVSKLSSNESGHDHTVTFN